MFITQMFILQPSAYKAELLSDVLRGSPGAANAAHAPADRSSGKPRARGH